jgi:hypothetical protein
MTSEAEKTRRPESRRGRLEARSTPSVHDVVVEILVASDFTEFSGWP